MTEIFEYQVSSKEKRYLIIRILVSVLFYLMLAGGIAAYLMYSESAVLALTVAVAYILFIVLFLLLRVGFFIGYLEGNAIKVSENQFPDIHNIVQKQSQQLGLSSVPNVYLLQEGGLLNAFVTSFVGTNYIVFYTDVVEAAYEKDPSVLEFIMGHELGHIKRKHTLTSLLLFPSAIVPFLALAHSRACEYTCDSIGFSLSPQGAKSGLLLLASGKGLMQRVKTNEYVAQTKTGIGFWCWFSEKFMSHPHLSKRLAVFNDVMISKSPKVEEIVTTTNEETQEIDDHSKYMPRF